MTLQSQQILVAGMLRPAHLLDLMRNFTVFQQVDGKTRKVVARYQQFRAIHKAITRLQEGRTRAQGAARDERGGIVWHTQGSGKSLSMVFLVRKMRMMPRLNRFKVVAVTDRTDLEDQLRETARLPVRRSGPTSAMACDASRQPPARSAFSGSRPQTSCSPCCKSIRT